MNTRDEFAKAAVQGLLAADYLKLLAERTNRSWEGVCEVLAINAYQIADAMIVESRTQRPIK